MWTWSLWWGMEASQEMFELLQWSRPHFFFSGLPLYKFRLLNYSNWFWIRNELTDFCPPFPISRSLLTQHYWLSSTPSLSISKSCFMNLSALCGYFAGLSTLLFLASVPSYLNSGRVQGSWMPWRACVCSLAVPSLTLWSIPHIPCRWTWTMQWIFQHSIFLFWLLKFPLSIKCFRF